MAVAIAAEEVLLEPAAEEADDWLAADELDCVPQPPKALWHPVPQ